MESSKILVTPETSVMVQKYLLSIGIKWFSGSTKVKTDLGEIAIYIHSGIIMTWSDVRDFNIQHINYKIITLKDLPLPLKKLSKD